MILFSFALSLLALLLQSLLYPYLPILPFAPFLALLCLKAPFSKAILVASGTGLLIDLLSSDPFGTATLNYALCILICSRWKSLFSIEAPIQLAFYTALTSFVSTQLQIALLFLFDRRINFQGKWWMTEWVSLPVFDAVYALIWFVGPLALFRTAHRKWMVYWLKKNTLNSH